MKDGSEEKKDAVNLVVLVASVNLVVLVACTKFGVNRPKQTKVIEWKLNFYF